MKKTREASSQASMPVQLATQYSKIEMLKICLGGFARTEHKGFSYNCQAIE